jgi:hypothetical protein
MSWPADGKPRYTVGAISGCVVGSNYTAPKAYVYDRACCHEIVATCVSRARWQAEWKATQLARALNGEEARWRLS